MRARWLPIPLLLIAFLCTAYTRADEPPSPAIFSFERNHLPIASLDGTWRFRPGDNPAWASPAFDDSAWKLLRSDVDWGVQGYLGLKGVAWYRFQVGLPQDPQPAAQSVDQSLALLLPSILTNYEVYANGALVGGCGEMPPHPEGRYCSTHVFDLPPDTYRGKASVLIALRVWQQASWSSYLGGGPRGSSYFGDAPLLHARLQSVRDAYFHSAMQKYFLAILTAMGGLVAIALFLFRRNEREYLWFGCMLLLWAAQDAWALDRPLNPVTVRGYYRYLDLIEQLGLAASVAFYYKLLQGRRSLLLYTAVCGLVLAMVAALLYSLPHGRDYFRVPVFGTTSDLLAFPAILWIVTLLVRRAAQKQSDALLLVGPVLLLYGEQIASSVVVETFQFGLQHRVGQLQWRVFEQPFPIDFAQLPRFIFLVAMLAFLVNRFARTRQKEERFANELEAARIVQQVLIPEITPDISGFSIASVYVPAGQVGGDFFQVIPSAAGGVLLIIGDVSGKGTPAAMTVSLLVGTVRTLAHYTQSPAEILSAMNQRMISRTGGGFTTCLVLRADPDGMVTAASAGHLSPYKNGEEVPFGAGLPLGLSPLAEYPETAFFFDIGDKLTLITDGVVEARSRSGELFGFDRTTAIAAGTAESIARTAQEFGQDDDITVLTIVRGRAERPSFVPQLQPLPLPTV